MDTDKIHKIIILTIIICLTLSASACSLLTPKEPNPSMTGSWYDFESERTYNIDWHKNKYRVIGVAWHDKNYLIVDQEWSDGKLSWTYIDRDISNHAIHVTFETGPYTQDFIITTKTIGKRGDTVQLFRVEE